MNVRRFPCLGDDLLPEVGGNIYYLFLTAPNRLIIEYNSIYNYDEEYAGTFEVILYETGDIKFQYQEVQNTESSEVTVGLDNGDGVNYNCFTGINRSSVPLYTKAIEFTFDKMIQVNCTLNCIIGEEKSYIIKRIDNDKMNAWFGTNWEKSLGLSTNPLPGYKTKFKIMGYKIIQHTGI
ncbi:MAG: hypothetical protein ACTSR8_21175 [Promethearchaeota archaeon]